MSRDEKLSVFVKYLSEKCPGCGGPKLANRWFCLGCMEEITRCKAEEWEHLGIACKLHAKLVSDLITYLNNL